MSGTLAICHLEKKKNIEDEPSEEHEKEQGKVFSLGHVKGTVHLQSNTPLMKAILESHFSATDLR